VAVAAEKKGELMASAGGKEVPFEYTLDDGLLTINCKEPLWATFSARGVSQQARADDGRNYPPAIGGMRHTTSPAAS
jgi:hypothetical protein